MHSPGSQQLNIQSRQKRGAWANDLSRQPSCPVNWMLRAKQTAMKRKLRIRTTVEKHEVVIIRTPQRFNRVLCPKCTEPVALVTLDQALMLSGIGSRAIYRLIEREQIHFVEMPATGDLICPATLLKRVGKEHDR